MTRYALTVAAVLLASLAAAPPGWAAWTWPLRGEVITEYRNGGDPYAGGQHRGVDIAGAVGSPVVAAAAGAVRFAGTAGSSGITVSVRTDDGSYDTSYLHLAGAAVRKGDRVGAGDQVGTVGLTGMRSAEAPHLHFGVRDAGSDHGYHDPLGFLPPAATAGLPQPEEPAPVGAPADAPRSAPVAAPAPRRVPAATPRRSPQRAPTTTPRRSPQASPQRAPAASPPRSSQPSPRRAPSGAPRDSPAGAPLRSPAGAPRRSPAAAPHRSLSPQHAPLSDRRRLTTPSPRRDRLDLDSRRSTSPGTDNTSPPPNRVVGAENAGPRDRSPADPAPPERSGPDAGWALACLGLLLAAGLVGTSKGGREAVGRRGGAVGRALRPLLERR